MNFPILSTLILLPLFGVFVISLVQGDDEIAERNIKNVSLMIASVCLILSFNVLYSFEPRYLGLQFEELYGWVSNVDAAIHFGVDGLSVYFLPLTNFLILLCILASWKSIQKNVKFYFICFLFLESMLNGFFVSINLFLFYVFFEIVLIPLFFIIAYWGGDERNRASFKMFLYTAFGSLFFLIAVIKIYIETGETDLIILQSYDWNVSVEKYLFLAIFFSLAIKLPMFPLHTWLPLAHTQAPTAGSVILAGVLLKMGGYGMLRVCLPLFPESAIFFSPYILFLSVVAILYTSLIALVQKDIKKLIAYSSVAHMGFVTLGIFSLNMQGLTGAVFQMISHGLISSALFLCVGILYDRFATRDINLYGGLYGVMPRFGVLFLIFILGGIGLPGTMGFVGEISVLIGAYKINPLVALISSLGTVLAASYGLWLYKRIYHGELSTIIKESCVKNTSDIEGIDRFNLMILAFLIVFFGLYTRPILSIVTPSMQKIMSPFAKILLLPDAKQLTKIDALADSAHVRKGLLK